MKVKLDRDECQTYFIMMDSPMMAARWIVELTQEELEDFRAVDERFWEWQTRLEKMIESSDNRKVVSSNRKNPL